MKVIICTWRIREWELQILNWSSSVQPEIVPLFTISFQCLKKKFKSWQVYDWLAKWLIMSGYMDLRRPRVYRRSNVGLVSISNLSDLAWGGGLKKILQNVCIGVEVLKICSWEKVFILTLVSAVYNTTNTDLRYSKHIHVAWLWRALLASVQGLATISQV